MMGGFDTGFIPQGSNIQVRLFAEIFATTRVAMEGDLVVDWPEALRVRALPRPGTGSFGIHYGADIGAEGRLSVTVLGQTFDWTGPIPFVPQFDFQVDEDTGFDPWAYAPGVVVSGETMLERLAQVDVTSFIGLNIPGLSGGFALDVWVELEATYQTNRIVVRDLATGMEVASFEANDASAIDAFEGGSFVDYEVLLSGSLTYDGTLHLVPTFFVNTLGPDLSIPITDVPIPFSFSDDSFDFDPVTVHVRLPDVDVVGAKKSLVLGDANVGTEVATHLTLANEGEARLVVAATIEGDPAFSIGNPDIALNPGFEGDVSVRFRPGAAGDAKATLVLTTNDPDQPEIRVALDGKGVPIDVGTGGAGGQGGGGGGGDEGDIELRGGGCACRTSNDGAASPITMIGLLGAVVVLARRRRRAV